MLEEIERDSFLLFIACREPIPLNIDYSHMQASNALPESVSDDSLARNSSLEEAMAKRSSLYSNQNPCISNNFLFFYIVLIKEFVFFIYLQYVHRPRQLIFSRQNPNFLDCELNMVIDSRILQYKDYYELLNVVKLILPDGRATWNPLGGIVCIYRLMLNCRVTLPL
ncbi:hypothetical protein ACOSQ2_021740 [Xanthoceras sorbifolium]